MDDDERDDGPLCAVDLDRDAEHVVVSVSGEVDLATIGTLQSALDEAVAASHAIVVDLGGVAFMALNGVDAVVVASQRARAHQGEVRVRGASPFVRRLFTLSEGADLLEPDG